MCLGIPMEIVEIHNTMAYCQSNGIERDVNLYLLSDQSLKTGDFVLVHVGYAIQTIDKEEAQIRLSLHAELNSLT